jgi:hypothetical protein
MMKWKILTVSLTLLMVGPSLRAGESAAAAHCAEGRAIFGKLSCTPLSSSETLIDAYFFGATSLREIEARYPLRIAKIGERCRKKMNARQPASVPGGKDRGAIRYRVETVESCLGKRGYQQPCVRDDDCLEHYCHPERGTCSAVFTVPISAAQ